MNNRQVKILEAITKKQRIEVLTLASMLEVSSVTIRKDLDFLEQMGLIRREHGFACIDFRNHEGSELARNYGLKQRIAKAAAATVEDNETVMIGSGSCCSILAEELANTKRDITIITNSVFLTNHIRHAPYGNIILLGGYYQHNSQILCGPITAKSAEMFSPDKFFISAVGFSEDFGFTSHDYIRAQTIRELSVHAKQVVMLFDSEKFESNGVVKLVKAEEISALYTDERIPPEKESYLLQKNVAVHKVAAA
jgi:DeoR/GlpR family transcriptional regulator of sugar metabolism